MLLTHSLDHLAFGYEEEHSNLRARLLPRPLLPCPSTHSPSSSTNIPPGVTSVAEFLLLTLLILDDSPSPTSLWTPSPPECVERKSRLSTFPSSVLPLFLDFHCPTRPGCVPPSVTPCQTLFPSPYVPHFSPPSFNLNYFSPAIVRSRLPYVTHSISNRPVLFAFSILQLKPVVRSPRSGFHPAFSG